MTTTNQPCPSCGAEIRASIPDSDEILDAIKEGLYNAMPYQSQILNAIYDGTVDALKRTE